MFSITSYRSAGNSRRFSPNLKNGEDQDFKIKVLSRTNKCVVISDRLYNYRLRWGSLSHSGNISTFNDLKLFVAWLGKYDDLPQVGRPVIEERVADLWWQCLRDTSYLGVLDSYWAESVDILNKMRVCFVSCVLKKAKWRKRCFIHSLGKWAVRLYFLRLRESANLEEKTTDYFT